MAEMIVQGVLLKPDCEGDCAFLVPGTLQIRGGHLDNIHPDCERDLDSNCSGLLVTPQQDGDICSNGMEKLGLEVCIDEKFNVSMREGLLLKRLWRTKTRYQDKTMSTRKGLLLKRPHWTKTRYRGKTTSVHEGLVLKRPWQTKTRYQGKTMSTRKGLLLKRPHWTKTRYRGKTTSMREGLVLKRPRRTKTRYQGKSMSTHKGLLLKRPHWTKTRYRGKTTSVHEELVLKRPQGTKTRYRGKTADLKNADTGSCDMKKRYFGIPSVLSSAPTAVKMLFGLVIFLSCLSVSPSRATVMIKSKQTLPRDCYKWMDDHHNDCPSIKHLDFNEMYKDLNRTCCQSDLYQGKDLHCQMDYYLNGTQFSKLACMHSVVVPAGYSGKIMSYDTENPYFDTYKSEGSLEHARPSWKETYPYGTVEKYSCDGIGEELLCEGNAGEKNQCICRRGFQPNAESCYAGFTNDASCFCEEKTCPQEFQPVRSFLQRGLLVSNVSCEEEFVVNFTCEPLPSTASPSGPDSSLIAPAKESDLTTQVPPHSTTARNAQQNQGYSRSISLALVALVVLLHWFFGSLGGSLQ